MRRPYGIGLLLLAVALILVTVGVTTSFQSGAMFFFELMLLLIVQLIIIFMLFFEGKWNFSHAIVFVVGIIMIAFLIKTLFSKETTNLEILLLIALNLAAFVIAVLEANTHKKKVLAPKKQTLLDTYDQVHTYDLKETKTQPTVKVVKAKTPAKTKKKVAKKTAKKTSKKTANKTKKKVSEPSKKKKVTKKVSRKKNTAKKAARKK